MLINSSYNEKLFGAVLQQGGGSSLEETRVGRFLPEGLQLLPVLGSPSRSSLRIKQREKGERLGSAAGPGAGARGAVRCSQPAPPPGLPSRCAAGVRVGPAVGRAEAAASRRGLPARDVTSTVCAST